MKVVHQASLKSADKYEDIMSKYEDKIEREKFCIYYDEDFQPLEVNSITEIFNMKVSYYTSCIYYLLLISLLLLFRKLVSTKSR